MRGLLERGLRDTDGVKKKKADAEQILASGVLTRIKQWVMPVGGDYAGVIESDGGVRKIETVVTRDGSVNVDGVHNLTTSQNIPNTP